MKTLQLQKGVRKPLITLFVLFLMGITINKALAQCPTTAPPLTGTTIANVCPVATVDLTTLHTAAVPAGSELRWYRDDTHTTGGFVNTPTDAPGGTYYAFYYRIAGNCYSPPSVPVIAITECCLANTAPILNSYSVSNLCPSFTYDLNTLYTGGLPGGITLRWFTNTYHQGTPYSAAGTAGEGTYYAFFYNAGAACYSPASLPVTVTIQCCGSIAAPPLTGNSLSNTCPGTGTVNLNSLHALPATPSGTQLIWFNNNAHVAHVGNRVLTPTAWNMGGTYYAYYYNTTEGCYSQPSAPVTVALTTCTGSCAGITSPPLSAVYATITCPSSTYDLNSLHTGSIPAGYQLQWRLFSGSTIVPDPFKAGAELYKVRYYNPVSGCGGPDVSVTIDIDHYNCPLDPVVNNLNGRYEITADAGGSGGAAPYTITIPKPAGATTIHSVWAYAAYVNAFAGGLFGRPPATPAENAALNAVTINGTPVPWTSWADSWTENPSTTDASCFVRYGEMSSLLAGTLNAAAPGSTVDITVAEPQIPTGVQGVGIIVVWNNPTKPVGSHLVLLGSIPTGRLARVELTTAPIDKTVPGFNPVLGAGVIFSNGAVGAQNASVKIGESEAINVVSYDCGGPDDGGVGGGAITLGGYQDDPLLNASDELYNVAPFLVQGQTHIRIDIQDNNANVDDFLSAIYFSGEGISLAPDLTPTTDIDGLSFTTGEARDFVVNIFEILNNPTVAAGQPVSFRINRLSGWDITVPGLTLTGAPQPGIAGTSGVFGGTPNQNDKWLFSQNAGFITVTLMPGEIINALGSMQIGFTATRKPGTVNGTSQNITATIINGSGGEIDFTNNRVITTISSN